MEYHGAIEDTGGALTDQIDAAYRTKYRCSAGSVVDAITTAQARSTTLELAPRAMTS